MINSFFQSTKQRIYLEGLGDRFGLNYVELWKTKTEESIEELNQHPDLIPLMSAISLRANGGTFEQLISTVNFLELTTPHKYLLGDGFVNFCTGFKSVIQQIRSLANYRTVKYSMTRLGQMIKGWCDPNSWIKTVWEKHLSHRLTKGQKQTQQEFQTYLGKAHAKLETLGQEVIKSVKADVHGNRYEDYHSRILDLHKRAFPNEGMTLDNICPFFERVIHTTEVEEDEWVRGYYFDILKEHLWHVKTELRELLGGDGDRFHKLYRKKI